jgi:superfamily II DNA or RNA helicase
MKLRPHQIIAKDLLRDSLKDKKHRPILAAPCSFGKTILAADLLKSVSDNGKRAIFITDRIQLINQSEEKFDELGLDFGIMQSNHYRQDMSKKIQIGSIQTIASRMKKYGRAPEFDFAIVDECFIGSTLVDGKRIDSLKAGDYVNSYNHKTNKVEKKKVIRVIPKKAKDICAIKTCNGNVYCTPNHKFWDGEKYEEIRNIKGFIYGVQGEISRRGWLVEKVGIPVQGLFRLVYTFFKQSWRLCQRDFQRSLPQGYLQGSHETREQSKSLRKNEPLSAKWRIGENEKQQSDEMPKSKSQNGSNTKEYWTQAQGARWQRQGDDSTAKGIIGRTWRWLGCRVHPSNWWQSIPKSLQNRYSKRGINDCNRGGWCQSLLFEKTKAGQEKERTISKVRLESYQVLKRDDIERLGVMPDVHQEYLVWDIEVEDNHNFFANGHLVHNCHVHYKATQELMDRYSAVPFVGLSASPYSRSLGDSYNNLVVPITTEELLSQGYLAPLRYYAGAHVDTKGIRKVRTRYGSSDFNPKELEARSDADAPKIVGDIIKNWTKHAYGRKTIAFTAGIKQSKYLVEQFNSIGVPAFHIDGYMDMEMRNMILDGFDKGEFMILSCSKLLTTGFDQTDIKCIIDAQPTASLILHIQKYGRGQRTHDGKEDCIILDHASNTLRHGFVEEIVPEELHTGEKSYNERELTKKEKKESKPRECPDCGGVFKGIRCECGYEIPVYQEIETDSQELKEISRKKPEPSDADKQRWLGELHLYGKSKGYKQGWARNMYKEKFKTYPNGIYPMIATDISPDVNGFIRHINIKNSYKRKQA